MSGLSIDHGGVVSVDTWQLRGLAHRLQALAALLDAAIRAVGRADSDFSCFLWTELWPAGTALTQTARLLEALRVRVDDLTTRMLLMAEVFEVVELRARAAALAVSDPAAAATVKARADRMLASDERLAPLAATFKDAWMDRAFQGMGTQLDGVGLFDWLFGSTALVGAATGLGTVRPGAVLRGGADPVRVREVASSRPSGAPKGLADAFRRMPAAGGAQVAVEKYTMPGGATRFVAYVAGSRSMSPVDAGGAEPWDMKSNVELYTGQRSASYQATREALAAAGARPGDRVDVVAHSQGGMIAARLAMQSEFDVETQMTAGSPVEPTLHDDQTLVQLRYSDDVVSGLAVGGSAAGTGSADSFTATSVGDPAPGLQDLSLEVHGLDNYLELAESVDASSDPRAEALDTYWVDLGTAVDVERTEYRAERTEQ